MTTTTSTTTQDFATNQTTPLVRMTGLIMAIMHIPSLIAGSIGLVASVIAYPLLPFTISAFGFGMSLYLKYWAIYKDTITRADARTVWKRTFYFNIVLLIPAVWANVSIGLSFGWFIVGFILVSIFLSQIALEELKNN